MINSQKSQIGLIGLAAMGENLARNIANHGFRISVFNRTTEKTRKFIEKFGTRQNHVINTNHRKSSLLTGTYTLKEFINSLKVPRKIILLVKAGEAVDAVIHELEPLLAKGDIIIDCGNSHFKDTERRQIELTKNNLNLIGCGISGGEEGALKGPSLMPGGNKEAWQKIRPIFEKIAAKPAYRQAGIFHKKPCVTYTGPAGSGHFVKMVHNGIEYAIMQLIAESYDILKNIGKFSNSELAGIFTDYGKTENLKSFLLEITAKIFTKKDPFKKSQFLIDFIKDSAGQKGTGKWTTEIAHDLGVAIPTINAAVDARILSSDRILRSGGKKLPNLSLKFKIPKKSSLPKIIMNALELSTIMAYIQGFELIQKADETYSWKLNLSEISRIWQGGCIIRSKLLKPFHQAYCNNAPAAKKAKLEILKSLKSKKQKDWRLTTILATSQSIPIPAITSALSYYDSVSRTHLPQNLIQAQRDFFGAHGYERTDKKGQFHTEW